MYNRRIAQWPRDKDILDPTMKSMFESLMRKFPHARVYSIVAQSDEFVDSDEPYHNPDYDEIAFLMGDDEHYGYINAGKYALGDDVNASLTRIQKTVQKR